MLAFYASERSIPMLAIKQAFKPVGVPLLCLLTQFYNSVRAAVWLLMLLFPVLGFCQPGGSFLSGSFSGGFAFSPLLALIWFLLFPDLISAGAVVSSSGLPGRDDPHRLPWFLSGLYFPTV